MKKNTTPKESMFWVYMKERQELLSQKENAKTDAEKKQIDKKAFECRHLAIQARKKEIKEKQVLEKELKIQEREERIEKIFNIGFIIWLLTLFFYLLATFPSFLKNLFQF